MFLTNPPQGRRVTNRERLSRAGSVSDGTPSPSLTLPARESRPQLPPRIHDMARIGIFGRAENRLRPVWQSAVPDHALALAWAPDNSRLAVAAVSGPIIIFDANSGKPIHQLKGHGFGTAALAWQPTGNLLVSVGQDSKVRVWDTATGHEVRALDAGASWAEKVVWHPSGQWLATAAGKQAKVWTAAGELVRALPHQAGTVMDVKWRPGTNHLTLLAYGSATTYDPLQHNEP